MHGCARVTVMGGIFKMSEENYKSLFLLVMFYLLAIFIGMLMNECSYSNMKRECAKSNNVYKCEIVAIPVEVDKK